MADKTSLSFLGCALGGAAFAVMLIGAMVVGLHLDGHLTMDGYDMAARAVVTQIR